MQAAYRPSTTVSALLEQAPPACSQNPGGVTTQSRNKPLERKVGERCLLERESGGSLPACSSDSTQSSFTMGKTRFVPTTRMSAGFTSTEGTLACFKIAPRACAASPVPARRPRFNASITLEARIFSDFSRAVPPRKFQLCPVVVQAGGLERMPGALC